MRNGTRSEKLEYAVHGADRSEAQRSLEVAREALRKVGGRAPTGSNGKRRVWSSRLGFHDNQADELLDPLTRFLSPAARALHEGRRRERADAALVCDVRAGRRTPDLEYRKALQRQLERDVTRDRFRRYVEG